MNAPNIQDNFNMCDDAIILKIDKTSLSGGGVKGPHSSVLSVPDFIHPHDVDQKVERFNQVSKDLILDYSYARVDKKTIIIQTLFKPIFTKLGESQKMAHFRVGRIDGSFYCERENSPLDIKVPIGVEPIPVHSIHVTELENVIQMQIKLVDKVETYKNIHIVLSFVKRLMQSIYEHWDDEHVECG
jgi:hypothetical protein